jgi:N-acetyl-alpha-D-glucosaminyl L-malate synthase BshA
MNIGIVCYPTFGGSGVVATELGKALAQKGHSIHFITTNWPIRLDHFTENVTYHEVNVLDYPVFEFPPYESALASKMVDVARFQHLDLLHVHYAIPHASSAIMAREILRKAYQIYVPILTTLHGTDITLVGKDQSFNPVVRYSIGESDGVSAVSDFLRQATIDTFQTDCEIRVIPNFIDLNRFKQTNKSHFKQILAPNGEKVIIHTSNFRKVKRIEDVIFIFKKVLEKIPTKLLMVGDGPERAKAEDLCRQMDLCDDIRFLGKQQSVEELLAISDLFLMPSGTESFGLAALEAMACSLPVISSDTGGLPELNVSGETGFLLPVGDVEGMAAAALQLLLDEKLLAKFSKNAEKRAQKFSLEEIVPLYENYYVEILKNSVSKHPINHSSF